MSRIPIFIRAALAGLAWLTLASAVPAQVILSEGFDTIMANVPGPGWFAQNNSTTPIGSTVLQGLPAIFTAQAGSSDSYAAMNLNASQNAGPATLSVWLVTPMITLENGTQISFYSRTVSPATSPDRLQLRYSTNGSSTNVGSLPNDVGDFTNLLLDINPTYSTAPFPTGYPTFWQNFTLTISGLGTPTTGRVAFRYFVENGGPAGLNSEYIGIDTLQITGVPEPTSMTLCAMAGGFVGWWSRRRRKVQEPPAVAP